MSYYTVFVDESGNLKEKRKDELVIYSILCINYNVYIDICEEVVQILDFVKITARIENLLELHAKEIVQRESAWRRVAREIRVRVFEKVVDLIREYTVYILCIAVYKRTYEKPSKVVERALSKLIQCISSLPNLVEKLHGVSTRYQAYSIIFDDAPYIRSRIENIEKEILKRMTCKGVNRVGINVRIGSSRDHIGLQLSDIVAYTVREVLIGRYRIHNFDFAKYFKQLTATGRLWLL